jgi:hypothetical protein
METVLDINERSAKHQLGTRPDGKLRSPGRDGCQRVKLTYGLEDLLEEWSDRGPEAHERFVGPKLDKKESIEVFVKQILEEL